MDGGSLIAFGKLTNKGERLNQARRMFNISLNMLPNVCVGRVREKETCGVIQQPTS